MARIDLRSTGGSSYGSNATAVSDANAPGVAASASRSDHRHLGVASITSSSSNTMADPTINLRAGANIGFALDIPSNTLTVSSTASGTVSYASNSNEVGSASDPGASTLLSRADHVHRGVYEVTSSASNTLSQRTVNLRAGSGIALGLAADNQTLTITNIAQGSGAGVSYGSNANEVGTAAAGGASTLVSRADHVHPGVYQVTASASNTLTQRIVNLRPGTGIALGVSADNQTVTITNIAGGGTGGSVSFGSNSNQVGTANDPGASSLASRADHVHMGYAVVTASSSNTLAPSTLNIRAGSGIALGVDASTANQTITITNISQGTGGGASSSTFDLTTNLLLMGG